MNKYKYLEKVHQQTLIVINLSYFAECLKL